MIFTDPNGNQISNYKLPTSNLHEQWTLISGGDQKE